MKQVSSLENLTLIMPTFNRSKFAKRSMNFWANTNVNLIVLDGSYNPLQKRFLESMPKSIQYLHNNDSWIDRMVAGSKLSKTPYTMLISDDEFYLPTALGAFINELDTNKEIVSIIGIAVAFYPFANKIYYRRIYKALKDASVYSDDPLDRVKYHMAPYRMTSLWGMVRTEIFKTNISVAKVCSSLPDPSSFELGFEIANSYQGKSKVLPLVSWLRSMENPPNWDPKLIRTHIWWKSKSKNKDLSLASKATELLLKSGQDFEKKLNRQILYIGIEQYVSNYNRNEDTFSYNLSKNSTKKIIKQLMPYKAYFFFIRLILLLPNSSKVTTWLSVTSFLKQLRSENLYISNYDLDIINKSIFSQ